MVNLWNIRTPPNFRFSAKFPSVNTQEEVSGLSERIRIILRGYAAIEG
jgi:uncharacterized protein YecE (DUF72 family)